METKARYKLAPRVSLRMVKEDSVRYQKVSNSMQVVEMLRYLQEYDREVFCVVHLDHKNKVIAIEHTGIGAISEVFAQPREVFTGALLCKASGIILAHNHPAGDPTPSRADIFVTGRLSAAGDLLGIKVLDHVIIGDNDTNGILRYFSFVESPLGEVKDSLSKQYIY